MAIVGTHLTTAGSGIDATSYTTESITPSGDRLILLSLGGVRSGAIPSEPTITGCGLTWVQVATITRSASNERNSIYRAMSGSPSAGVVTIDYSGETQLCQEWSIAEFSGVNTSGTNGANAIVQAVATLFASGTSGTVTLDSFQNVANATYGAFFVRANEAVVEGSGFTLLGTAAHTAPTRAIGTEWRNDNDTSVDMSWTTNIANHAIALELREASVPVTVEFIGWGMPI